MAVAPPRQHVLDGTTTPQRTVSAVGQPAAEAIVTDEPAAVKEAPGARQSSERRPALSCEDDTVQALDGDGGEPAARMAAAEVVQWWAESIQLSGRGTLVWNASHPLPQDVCPAATPRVHVLTSD